MTFLILIIALSSERESEAPAAEGWRVLGPTPLCEVLVMVLKYCIWSV